MNHHPVKVTPSIKEFCSSLLIKKKKKLALARAQPRISCIWGKSRGDPSIGKGVAPPAPFLLRSRAEAIKEREQ
jgi:hypothetical protein